MKRRQYSESFKSRVVAAKLAGASPADLAVKHGIPVQRIWTWVALAKKARAVVRGSVAAKGHRSRAGKTSKTSDAERIVTELLASLRPGLVEAIGKLVDLGVERKLASTRQHVLDALQGAA